MTVDVFQEPNLQAINEDENDLEQLAKQSDNIVGNLKEINEDENDLDQLDKQTDSIVGNLKTIND